MMNFLLYVAAVTCVSGLKTKRSAHSCSLKEQMQSELMAARGHSLLGACNAETVSLAQPGVDHVSFVSADQSVPKPQLAVWISGYPRSGSSTALSMVSATVDDNRDGSSRTFSVFEPCHDGDEYDWWKIEKGCYGVLEGISHCHFEGIKTLWGMDDPHSTNGHEKDFSAERANLMCQQSRTVAFKTVDYGHNLSAWTSLLDSHPRMRVLDVVRDPRAIYASWKMLEPFASLVKAGDYYTITGICKHFAANLNFTDPRIYRLSFEKLMSTPAAVTKEVYNFLEEPYGPRQVKWIQDTFYSEVCPPPTPGRTGFQDCHVVSPGSFRDDKWRTELSMAELASFRNDDMCQQVAKAYGYPSE